MHSQDLLETPYTSVSIIRKPVVRVSIIVLLFISAFAIRLYHIQQPPLDFVPVRQYQNAHIARGYYYETLDSIPEWKKEISRINMERIGFVLEPRIIETIAVLGYRVLGGEHLWIPRVMSSIFWLVGGLFLFFIARKIASLEEALFSTAFYLFLPFGISASRSFQPDPLMTMMLIISIFTVVKYSENPTWKLLIIAAIVSALAMLVKPYTLFLIYGAFLMPALFKEGIKKTVFNVKVITFIIVSFFPTAVYYVFGILNDVGFLQELAQGSFLPQLLVRPYFWGDWLRMIGHVTGYVPFIFAIAGLMMFRSRPSKSLLYGLWVGYVLFGLFFTFHIHTHAYYQLQFIPVVALSLGPIGSKAVHGLSSLFNSRRRAVVSILAAVLMVSVVGLVIGKIPVRKYKEQFKTMGSIVGINPEFHKFLTADFQREVEIAQKIGMHVNHSTDTVFLTPFYGRYITYHGEFAGLPWPTAFSLQERRERGLEILGKDELFNPGYLMIRTHGKYVRYKPDYFIITAFDEFDRQGDLKEFLRSSFPVLAQTDDYIIFNLRAMSENGSS